MIRTTFSPAPATRPLPPTLPSALPSALLLAPEPTPRAVARPRRERSALRLALRLAGALLGGAAVTVAVAFVAATALGYKQFTVMSGSMSPTIPTGDVIVDERISPLDARIGDVVTFRDPVDGARLISHRVVAKRVADGTVYFQTKGDANNDVQKWTAPADGSIGRVVLDVPKVGYLLFWLSNRYGRLAFVVLPLLLLGAFELRAILRAPSTATPSSGRARHARRS